MRIAALILAAGASTRFGSPKQEARLGDGTMLDAVVGTARAAGLDPLIVVAPSRLALPDDVVRVRNDDPGAGMGMSLRLGVHAVPMDAAAVLLLLADQPTVSAAHLRRLLAAANETDAPVIITHAAGVDAPPAIIRRSAFGLLERASGDEGLRGVVADGSVRVARVAVPRHAPDVDRTDDLAALVEPCPGCGERYAPSAATETHGYLGASPACWAVFGEVLAREFSDPAYGWIHRHTVDVYTVQHPGTDGRKQRQSVAIHLIALCGWLESGLDMGRLNPISQRLANEARDWPWLEPPSPPYGLTVADVLAARSGAEHSDFVRAWAVATWDAWSAHHDIVRQWTADAGR